MLPDLLKTISSSFGLLYHVVEVGVGSNAMYPLDDSTGY